MRVLVACEFTGTVRDAFAARGHDAWSSDLRPTERPGNHYRGDVRDILSEGWDLMVAHPPCRYLSYAANHVWDQPGREQKRSEAMEFFLELYNAPIPRVCVENPLGLPNSVFRKPNQIIHPYYFGESHLKRTCLWLRGLPNLWYWFEDDLFGSRTAAEYPEPIYATQRESGVKLRYFSEAAHGEEKRSRTFPSVAEAMATQWG